MVDPKTTAALRPVRFVAFPKDAVDTIPCPTTGEPMLAQIVARWGEKTICVPCPHCHWCDGTMQWHQFEVEAVNAR